jgi:hypothetical protein
MTLTSLIIVTVETISCKFFVSHQDLAQQISLARMLFMDNKNSLCVMPWVNITDHFSWYTPCPHINQDFEKVEITTYSETINHHHLSDLRKQMLQGHKPDACKNCFLKEESGLKSHRQSYNEEFSDSYNQILSHSNEKISLDEIKIIHLKQSNYCTQACRTCTAENSTTWNNEAVALKRIEAPLNYSSDNFQKLSHCETYIFDGGEPLLHESHLPYLQKIQNPEEKSLIYFTSLSFNYKKLLPFFPIWERFKSVELFVSIDHYKKDTFEYIRYKSSWKEVKKNYLKLKQTPLKIKIQLTLSILNIFDLPEIIDSFTNELNTSEGRISLYPVNSPPYYSITSLPTEKKEIVSKKINRWLKERIKESNFNNEKIKLYSQIKSIINYMNKINSEDSYHEFLEVNGKLDRWRNQILSRHIPFFK